MRQLHALAEAEMKLSFHQKRLSEIDAKVILNFLQFPFLYFHDKSMSMFVSVWQRKTLVIS